MCVLGGGGGCVRACVCVNSDFSPITMMLSGAKLNQSPYCIMHSANNE